MPHSATLLLTHVFIFVCFQVAFIKQEAVEKAREIQIKADEEFAIEKAKIVRQEAINIDSQYDKKIKQAEVAQKM